MKFTLSWLKEHLETGASPEEIANTLTSLGLEVEKMENRAKDLEPFIIAEILAAEKHPAADKLQLCKVNTGKEILQIVCGAANARSGLKVVLAPVGSIIPANDMQIKAAKIRGVESNGMLCSSEELALPGNSEGIIELAGDAPVGKKFAEYAELNDTVFEIAITPNRGDSLGVRGIARDLAAKGLGKLKPLKTTEIRGKFSSPIKVSIENNTLCPLFVGRYFKNVKNYESPEWLKKRLISIGLKPISALVDITNFICHDLSRPLHVYDAKKLRGNIHVREISAPDNFRALDDKTYNLAAKTLVIADDSAPVALAGVMGGKDSGCDFNTTEVFLETAIFDSAAVAKTGRQTMINFDSRYRFERGLDHNFARMGAEIASRMILEICGGEASVLEITGTEKNPSKKISFDMQKVKELGGVTIEDKKIISIFEALGFTVKKARNGLEVSIPSWRNDISNSADLVEEILRVNGYETIPTVPLPVVTTRISEPSSLSHMRHTLAARGMLEVVTFSFMSSEEAKNFTSTSKKMTLLNPISSDLDFMRPSIIPNLLEAAKRNIARDYLNLALFEVGPQFSDSTQQMVAAGARVGENHKKNIYQDSRFVDFFDVKADVLALLPENIDRTTLEILPDAPKYYHPGKSAVLKSGKNILAVFGELHPAVLAKMKIDPPVAAFEIYLENLPMKKPTGKPNYQPSNFQAVERDFAFIFDDKALWGDVKKAVKAVDKEMIEEVWLFDKYTGKGIADGKKSLAFLVKLQPKDHTLEMPEIEAISQKIIGAVTKLGGQLRS